MWDRKHGILSYRVMQISMFPMIGDISQRGSLPLCGHPDYDTCTTPSGAEKRLQVLMQQWGLKLEQIWGEGGMNCETVFETALTISS